jgi:hypothetical protein
MDALRKNRESHNINMALHKSQRTKNFNPGLMEGFNIVFFFHLSTILEINYLAPSFISCEKYALTETSSISISLALPGPTESDNAGEK